MYPYVVGVRDWSFIIARREERCVHEKCLCGGAEKSMLCVGGGGLIL